MFSPATAATLQIIYIRIQTLPIERVASEGGVIGMVHRGIWPGCCTSNKVLLQIDAGLQKKKKIEAVSTSL